ncbi:MAG: ABC transporter substrate-binding protein [Deltaproteobacteria bacterium]|nr:ABC transporter substrate-binding protein [Deltaproteobacteria bacterium]
MRRIWSLIAVLALATAGCTKPGGSTGGQGAAPVPAGPKELQEVEPNDGASSAMSLREASKVSAEIKADSVRQDDDCYRIEPLGVSRAASFEVSGIPGVDLAIELLDRDGNHVAIFNSEGEGRPERIAHLNLASPWIAKVFPSKKGSGGAYTATLGVADAPADFEVEPDNRAVDATLLPLGKAIKALLADRADEDWFRIEVPVPGATPTRSGDSPPPQPAPGTATAPAAARPPSPEPGGEPGVQAPPTGPASVAVAAVEGEPGAPPPPPPPQPVDPPAGDSNPSSLPTAVVKLEVAGVPEVRLQVEVSNQAQAVFYTARSREIGEGIQVRNLALRPGETTYFVTVKSAWTGTGKDARRGYNGAVPYSIAITPEEAGSNAELEPNDEASKATLAPADGAKIGFFAPKGDLDYFAVRCERPSLLKVELSGVDRVDSVLSLIQPNGEGGEKEEVLLRANDGGVREGEILVNVECGPGHDALLRVEAAPRQQAGKWVRDQDNPDESYRLSVTSRTDTGESEREANSEATTATPIELGKPLKGHIHPRKDVDYFQVDLSKSPVKVPLKATVTGILKVDVALALYRVEGDASKPTLVQRSEKGKGEQSETIRFAVEPGAYLLEVKDTKSLQSNFMDAYQLTVEQEQ